MAGSWTLDLSITSLMRNIYTTLPKSTHWTALQIYTVAPKLTTTIHQKEAHLMLTNLRDAFRGQSRSSNIVPFHVLGTVSSCAIVTLSLWRAVFKIFDFKKCCDLEIRVRGHSRSLKVVPLDKLWMISYLCSTETWRRDFKNAVTLKTWHLR